MNILQEKYNSFLNELTSAFTNPEHPLRVWIGYSPKKLWELGFFNNQIIEGMMKDIKEEDIDEFIEINKNECMKLSALRLKLEDSEENADITLKRMLFVAKFGIAASFIISQISLLFETTEKGSNKSIN